MAQTKKSQNALREMVLSSGNVKPSATSSTFVGKSIDKKASQAAAIAARRASFATNKAVTVTTK